MDPAYTLDQIYLDLFNRGKKVVGWGTGSLYDHYRKLCPLALDYLVDNDPEKWGQMKDGYVVKSPSELLGEDAGNLIIIVYSSFLDQICEQLRSMGDFTFVSAGSIVGYETVAYYISKLKWKMGHLPMERKPKPRRAIVIQGPIIKDINVSIIQHYAQANNTDTVIVSTWESTNPILLKKLEPWVDHLVLSAPPDYCGYQNRNYQIISTLAGIKKAQELGAEYVLKTRVDIALLADNILDVSESLMGLYDPSVAQSYGLKNRIFVPESYTRKYIPYHPSDLVMFGHTADLLKFWDMPLDERRFSLTDDEWKRKSLNDLGTDRGPAECYFGVNFAKKIKRIVQGTVEDSWAFYRDFFVMLDFSWYELFFLKYPKISSMDLHNITHECVSHGFWQQLYFNCVDRKISLNGIDPKTVTWGDREKDLLSVNC